MAAPPSTASPASSKPAVPPPPVTGAGGYEVYAGLGEGGGAVEGVWLGVGLALGEPLSLAEPLALGEKPVIEAVGVEVVVVPVVLAVHAESATQVSTVIRPQPMAAGLSRCALDAMAVRAPIEPPRALGNHHFPMASRQTARAAFAGDRPGEELLGENTSDHNGKPRLRREPTMARPPSEYYAG
jgi:hypothetical protein